MSSRSVDSFSGSETDDRFGRLARTPGGPSRDAMIKAAEVELARVKPRVAAYVKEQCKTLEVALLSAGSGHGNYAAAIAEAHLASQDIRDIAESVGFPLMGFIAANICTIIEVVEEARLDYPAAVLKCHIEALRLAQKPDYERKKPTDLPALSAGLLRTMQVVKDAAVRTSEPAKMGNDY